MRVFVSVFYLASFSERHRNSVFRHLARKKGESEKEEGVEIVHFFADDYNWPL